MSEVLLSGLWGTAQRLASMIPLPPEQIDRQLKHPAWDQFLTGRMFEDQYWSTVRRAAGWNVPIEYLERAVRQNFREIEGIRPQIIDLRRRGYVLGLLSNHAREWAEYLEQQFKFHQLFDDRVWSFEVGMVKPDRAIYALAMRRLGAEPESTLMIDDDPGNLLAANELGMHVQQCITAHQLAEDLRRRGITE